MEHLNLALFLLLNAGQNASSIIIGAARFLAEGFIWIVPAGLVIGWLRGSSATRQALIAATIAGLAGLLINQLIGLAWYHPRPFEIGVGRTLIQHVQDSSFPSDHLTLIWAVAFSLLLHQTTRRAGAALAMMGLPVAWARLYLGVHFPLDMAGAAGVAFVCAWALSYLEGNLVVPVYRTAERLYQRWCVQPIRARRVRKQ